jgi:nitrate/nitrite-specific signal transduction histidine kinase
MKIRTNLFLLSATSVILIATIGFTMFHILNQMSREIGESSTATKMIKDIFELNIVTHEYLMHREKRMQQQWLLKYKSLGRLLEKARKEELHSEHLSPIKSMTADYKLFGDLFSHLQANFAKRKRLIEENKPQVEINFLLASEERLMAEVLMRAHRMTTGAFKLSAEIEQMMAQTHKRTNLIIISYIIGFTIFAFSISFLITRAITRPLDELVKGTEIIGEGNLEHRVDIRTKNEIGGLAVSFNQMAADLRVSKDKIESHSKDLEKEVQKRTRELEKTKAGLEETVKRRTKELQERVSELERYHDATTDRELRMKELREEIERLKVQRPLEQKS